MVEGFYISQTVVMGITWITGVLVREAKELFALAFIFTIFVALIFILFCFALTAGKAELC